MHDFVTELCGPVQLTPNILILPKKTNSGRPCLKGALLGIR